MKLKWNFLKNWFSFKLRLTPNIWSELKHRKLLSSEMFIWTMRETSGWSLLWTTEFMTFRSKSCSSDAIFLRCWDVFCSLSLFLLQVLSRRRRLARDSQLPVKNTEAQSSSSRRDALLWWRSDSVFPSSSSELCKHEISPTSSQWLLNISATLETKRAPCRWSRRQTCRVAPEGGATATPNRAQ